MSEQIFIFDTTLRDGEQSPGAALNIEEKFQIAQQIARLNVNVIEAGFPISSPEDFESVSRIAAEIEGPEICGLSRVLEPDITRCWEAIKHAQKPRIHTFVGTSDIHIEGILRKNREETLKMAVDAVKIARSLCKTVEFSPMDATRTEPSYLYDVIEATIAAGANIINIPDTVGYAMPEQFGQLICDIRANVPNIDQAVISVHCHDDLGMAVANSLAAMKNGVRQIECTINGLGERAGNTSLEEVVMAIKTRVEYFDGACTEVNAKEIYPASRLVSRLMGFVVPANKAVVGANAFVHSSGIHQDGVIKRRTTFEIMRPEDIGIPEDTEQLSLTARSGRNGLHTRLKAFGHELTDEQLDKVYDRFILVADKKKEVHDADLEAIIQDEIQVIPNVYILKRLHAFSVVGGAKDDIPWATVVLVKNGQDYEATAEGDGPVDAAYKAIDKINCLETELTDYNIQAVTRGKDAIAEATVRLESDDQPVIGHGASTDVIEASAKAYLNALNRMAANQEEV